MLKDRTNRSLTTYLQLLTPLSACFAVLLVVDGQICLDASMRLSASKVI